MSKKFGPVVETMQVYHTTSGTNLPKWVKENVKERGYCDSMQSLVLWIGQDDIDEAFACVAAGDGARCVMAQAAKRIGAEAAYFYRTTAYVMFPGDGPILRYETGKSIYNNIIKPFDDKNRDKVISGLYTLMPPKHRRIASERKRHHDREHPRGDGSGKRNPVVAARHTDRLVLAALADGDSTW
jgi:hypothetical protein